MAVADPFPAMSVPIRSCRDVTIPVIDENTVRARKLPLDTKLLCSKLETFQREQEAARARREKRKAVRNGSYVPRIASGEESVPSGSYVPRSAAKSFAATATPMKDITNLPTTTRARKHASAPPSFITEPLTTDGRIRIPSKQLYAALNFGFDNQNAVAPGESALVKQQRGPHEKSSGETPGRPETKSSEREQQQSRPHTNPSEKRHSITKFDRRDSITLAKEKRNSIKAEKQKAEQSETDEVRTQSPSAALVEAGTQTDDRKEKRDSMNPSSSGSGPRRPRKTTSPSPDRERGQYRPGDAAKRRSLVIMGTSSIKASGNASERTAHTLTENIRTSRFLETDTTFDGPIPELEEFTFQPPLKLQPNDRPDWSQTSQSGKEMRHTLHFFHTTEARADNAPPEQIKKRTSMLECNILAPFVEPKAAPPKRYSGPQSDHMIADAVRIIKSEERMKRRQSIVGFFKKL